ncbi:hypothetical protein BJV77DRAFT_1038905, partial [Russula vinacea]
MIGNAVTVAEILALVFLLLGFAADEARKRLALSMWEIMCGKVLVKVHGCAGHCWVHCLQSFPPINCVSAASERE